MPSEASKLGRQARQSQAAQTKAARDQARRAQEQAFYAERRAQADVALARQRSRAEAPNKHPKSVSDERMTSDELDAAQGLQMLHKGKN